MVPILSAGGAPRSARYELRGGPHQPGQQPDVGRGLRVPLHGDAEPVARQLHRLEGAVVEPGQRARSRGRSPRTGGGGSCTVSRSPTRPARRVPARVATVMSPNSSPPGLCSSWSTTSGVCWCRSRRRARPSAACRGRRRAPGARRPPAASSSATSQASRSGRQLAVRGCGSAPYRRGSTSAPPVMTSPSRRATSASAAPVLRHRRQQHGDAAGGLDRQRVRRGAARRPSAARPPTPPPRGRWSGRSAGVVTAA